MTEPLFFSFSVFAKAIASQIKKYDRSQGFVIGITGPWGSGKTTLMQTVITGLGNENYISTMFNAWAHSKQDVVWRAFFVSIVATLRHELDKNYSKDSKGNRSKEGKEIEKFLDESEQALYTAFSRETPGQIELEAGKLAKTGAKLALKFVPWGDAAVGVTDWVFSRQSVNNADTKKSDEEVDEPTKLEAGDIDELWGVFKRSVVRHHVAKIESLEQFRNSIEKVLDKCLSKDRKLVIAIDDVDRCLPEQGLEVFEAIKLFLDLPNTIFLVAMDQEVLQLALDLRYKQNGSPERRITAELYAEKMIDLLFPIPTPTKASFRDFVGSNLPLSTLLSKHFDLLNSILPANPRTWTRFAHRTALRIEIVHEILGKSEESAFSEIEEAALLKMESLWFLYPQFMRSLGSFENYIGLEEVVSEAKINSNEFRKHIATSKDIEPTLKNNTTKDITSFGIVPGTLNDFKLLQFIEKDIKFFEHVAIHPLLSSLFALDIIVE